MPAARPLALITGASRGIGYELAREFAQNGHNVILAADHEGRLKEAAQGIRSAAQDARVEIVACDLSTREGVETLWQAARQTGPVEVLAANAGRGLFGDFRETDLEAELEIIQLNVTSVVHLTKLVLRDMTERDSGKILITASIESTTPDPFQVVYAASKAFVLSFAQGVREDLKDTGITVTALMPGATATDFFERAQMENSKIMDMDMSDPAEVAREGYAALMRGDDHIVVGMKNKMHVTMSKFASDKMKAKAMGKMAGPKE